MIYLETMLRMIGFHEELDVLFQQVFFLQMMLAATILYMFVLLILAMGYQLKNQREHAKLVRDHDLLWAQHEQMTVAHNNLLQSNAQLISDRIDMWSLIMRIEQGW